MSRLAARFQSLKEQSRTALIPFVTAGDPLPKVTVPLMHAMVAAGADVLELGIPFSDPMADGPVIQRASERALASHTSLRDVLAMVSEFRQKDADTPVVLMGYLNPIEVMGYQAFAVGARAAGVDGVITVDIPPEEAGEFLAALSGAEIDPIFLIAPTSTAGRIKSLCQVAGGFVYYVSVKGVTGSAKLDIPSVAAKLEQIRQVTRLPIGVGFGIKDAESAAQVARVADAVVVGSALVARIEDSVDQPDAIFPRVTELLAEMRAAMDKQ